MVVGIQESMIDYPGRMCVILFTQACRWNCVNCHNKKTLPNAQHIPDAEVLKYLVDSMPLIDSVTISGGEPTEYKGILELIKNIKSLGMHIKLDTNGSNPDVLTELLPYIDVVAMDIKCSLDDMELYMSITSCSHRDYENAKNSLMLLSDWCKSGGHLILRTTLLDPRIDPDKAKESVSKYTYTDYTVQSEII